MAPQLFSCYSHLVIPCKMSSAKTEQLFISPPPPLPVQQSSPQQSSPQQSSNNPAPTSTTCQQQEPPRIVAVKLISAPKIVGTTEKTAPEPPRIVGVQDKQSVILSETHPRIINNSAVTGDKNTSVIVNTSTITSQQQQQQISVTTTNTAGECILPSPPPSTSNNNKGGAISPPITTALVSTNNKQSTTTTAASSNNTMAAVVAVQRTNTKPCCFCWCCCCTCSWKKCLAVKSGDELNSKNKEANYLESLGCDGEPPPTLDDIRSWGFSFDKLMKSSAGRKVFRDFLKCEYSEENILFYLACEELKRESNPEVVEEKARFIYEDYISILSPKEVSLDSRVREIVNKNMVDPTPNTFDEAQLQIYTLMHRDSYPRFINSHIFKRLAQLNNNSSVAAPCSSATPGGSSSPQAASSSSRKQSIA